MAGVTRQFGNDRLTEFLIRYRWVLVVFFLLPLSTIFNLAWSINRYGRTRLSRPAERHTSRVEDIRAQIQAWHAAGKPGRLCTSRRDWLRISARIVNYKKPDNSIRVDLHDILALDIEAGTITVEPRVTIGQLIDYLVPKGWTLPVVPEVDDLTVSGLYLGYGVEVSSHKFGLFSELVRSCDVVLGDGRLVTASPTENTDLFNALPWSQGSLEFVVALRLRITPAKPYVRVEYDPAGDADSACALFERVVEGDAAPDFVEAIVFSPNQSVVISGRLVDQAEAGKIHPANLWYQPWFARRCQRLIAAGPHVEYIPLTHFYRRHHRGMYWESELILPFGNHPLFRYVFGWMMPPKVSFLRLTQGRRIKRYYDEKHVLQDALVPLAHLRETVSCFAEIFDAYPVWLCPMWLPKKEPAGFVTPATKDAEGEMYVDVAVITVPGPVLRGEPYNALDATRQMEQFLLEHRGYQALYAVTQLSHDEFRAMFDHTLYDAVRRRYAAEETLMDIYDKVRLPTAEEA